MKFIKYLLGEFGKLLRTKFKFNFSQSIYRHLGFNDSFTFQVNDRNICMHSLCSVSNDIFYSGIYGNYEGHSLRIWNHLCMNLKDSYVFDIGGYSGAYSLVAASANHEVKIHTFEPHPNTFRILKKNIDSNTFDNIYIHNFALSLSDGDITFYNSVGHAPSGFSSINHKYISRDAGTLVCKSKDISRLLDSDYKDKRISLMKLDIERAELPLLQQIISRLINDSTCILCEILDEESYQEFDTLFTLNGYKSIQVDDNNKKAIEVNNLKDAKKIGRNVVFIPDNQDTEDIIKL